jgi:hypothetical protein
MIIKKLNILKVYLNSTSWLGLNTANKKSLKNSLLALGPGKRTWPRKMMGPLNFLSIYQHHSY